MKKLLLTAIMLLFTTTCFATPIVHTITSANIKVDTTDFWSKLQTKQTSINQVPANQINFLPLSQTTDKLAILVLNGSGNESFMQTSEDFKKGNAKLILAQIVEQEKKSKKDGFTLDSSEVKKISNTDYIYLKYQKNQLIRYSIMTMLDNYSISINCETTKDGQDAAEQNLNLMMQTLTLIKG